MEEEGGEMMSSYVTSGPFATSNIFVAERGAGVVSALIGYSRLPYGFHARSIGCHRRCNCRDGQRKELCYCLRALLFFDVLLCKVTHVTLITA